MAETSGGGLKPVLKGLAMLAVFGGLVAVARLMGFEQHLNDKQWLMAHVEGQGAAGVFFYLGFTALVTSMGLPRQLTAFLGGYAFNVKERETQYDALDRVNSYCAAAVDFTVTFYEDPTGLGEEPLEPAQMGEALTALPTFEETTL